MCELSCAAGCDGRAQGQAARVGGDQGRGLFVGAAGCGDAALFALGGGARGGSQGTGGVVAGISNRSGCADDGAAELLRVARARRAWGAGGGVRAVFHWRFGLGGRGAVSATADRSRGEADGGVAGEGAGGERRGAAVPSHTDAGVWDGQRGAVGGGACRGRWFG